MILTEKQNCSMSPLFQKPLVHFPPQNLKGKGLISVLGALLIDNVDTKIDSIAVQENLLVALSHKGTLEMWHADCR